METNNEQMVEATAPIMQTREEKTLLKLTEVRSKITSNELADFISQILNDIPNIYDLDSHNELVDFMTLENTYNEEYTELNTFKNYCNQLINSLTVLNNEYPEILESCTELNIKIEHENNYRKIFMLHLHKRFYAEHSYILNAQQEILNKSLANNLTEINKLNRNTKQIREDEAANPDLITAKKERKNYLANINKQIKPKIKRNDLELTVYQVKELIESKCSMEFTRISRWNWGMEFNDGNISIRIDDDVEIVINGSEKIELGSSQTFDINLFLENLPKKYWVAKNRDQRIDEILMD